MAMSTEDRIAAAQQKADLQAAIAANGGVDPALTAQFGITDPDLISYLNMASLPTTIAWGDPSMGGSRSQEQAARRATTQFASMGGQARLNRIKAKIAADPALQAQLAAYTAAGNKGDMFSRIGDALVSATPTALKLAALGGGADIAMGGGLFGAGGVAGAGSAQGMTAAELAASDPYLASIGGAGGVTGGMETAGMLSSAASPGVAASTAASNVATGLGYDMLGTAATGGMLSSVSPALAQAAQTLAQNGITQEVLNQAVSNPSIMDKISKFTGLSAPTLGQIASTGLGLLGSAIQGQSATEAAQTAAQAQIEAARIAAEASKFRPVGVTTRFGGSQFGYDAAGNLTSAGYQLSPEAKAQQDVLMGMSGKALAQYQASPAATAPLGQGAQTLFGLGQGYLATTPQDQAAKYMAEQQALLAPTRERQMAALQNRLQAQGRLGLATGGTSTGMMAANPELEAFYNAQRMQDLQLASQATQGGQQYATFGAGLLGTGSDLQRAMYGTQQAAFAPYQTALGGATTLEQLGQQPMDIGTSIGARTSTAAAQAGLLQAQGMTQAAQTMQPANAYSPWGALLTGAGQAIGQYSQPVQNPPLVQSGSWGY